MQQWHPNDALNAHFELQDYMVSGTTRSTDGFLVDRWFGDFTGSGIVAGPGVGPNDISIPDELRARATIDVTVTASAFDPATSNLLVRERVPWDDRMERQTKLLRVWAVGPVGGQFEIALSGSGISRRSAVLKTRGALNPEPAEVRTFIRDISTNYLTLELFTSPADVDATYQILAVQLETLADGQQYGRELVYSPPHIERARCAPFVWACPSWLRGRGAAGQTLVVMVATPVPMNSATPAVVAGASPVSVVQVDNSANVFTSAAPSPGFDATPNRNEHGGRVVLSGFTSPSNIVAGTEYALVTPRAFLLEAEL